MATRASLCALLLAATTAASAESAVHVLTDANFDEKTQDGLWLLKFYAPWCGHCNALAPVLDAFAAEHKDKINVGKVDCTSESGLASRFGVRGYPTLKFRTGRDAPFRDFCGQRTKEAFVEFALRMSGPPVHTVDSPAALRALLSRHGVVMFIGEQQGSGDAVEAVKQVAVDRQDILTFASSGDPAVLATFAQGGGRGAEAPFLAKLEPGEDPVFFPGDVTAAGDELAAWVDRNRFPMVTEIGPSTFRPMKESGLKLAIAVVDPSRPKQATALVERMQRIARSEAGSPLDDAVRAQYLFGHIDGVSWADFLAQYSITKETVPGVFVLDPARSVYYPAVTNVASTAAVASYLTRVADGEVEGTAEAKGFIGTASRFVTQYWPYSIGVIAALLGFIALIAYLLAYELCCADDGDITEKELEEVDAAAAAVHRTQAAVGGKPKGTRAKKDD